jgi:hypothetical protein
MAKAFLGVPKLNASSNECRIGLSKTAKSSMANERSCMQSIIASPAGISTNTKNDTLRAYALQPEEQTKFASYINVKTDVNYKTLQTPKKRKDIIIKPADKNVGIAIMSTAWYNLQVESHLKNDFELVTNYNTKMESLVQVSPPR